ncbi:MAG: ribonuclease III [Alphaproteobacteria bacterium]|nr:ribonuclease III [Alphaproteobacteria bacterium]
MAVCDPLQSAVPVGSLNREQAAETTPHGGLDRLNGYVFTRPELLAEALTHPSAAAPAPGRGRRRTAPPRRTYERLEFLGDRVLGLVIADLLWRRYPTEPEGDLTRRHAHLVCRDALARVGGALGLDRSLKLSPGEAAAGAARHPAIVADVCEAVIAAVYLDGGLAAATDFVMRLWTPLVEEMEEPPRDPKTALQEWTQARGLGLPAYALVESSGPDHAPRFTVAVRVAGIEDAVATASSKRSAETRAAASLLERLNSKGRQ